MKINITKKEYRTLLDMLYVSDWVMHSHVIDREPNKYQELRKKLLSYHKEMEVEDLIEYSSKSDDYYELRDYEDELHKKFIHIYDEQTFWDELADRLATRDLLKETGINGYETLESMDRFMKLDEIATSYTEEFEQHGLEHVQVMKCER